MTFSSDDPSQAITLSSKPLLDQNPVAVYLASLNSKSGRRTMRQVLDLIARTLSNGQLDALDFPWGQLRYQHTQAVRAWLVETYKPATANKALCALRGVLKQAWMLGHMTAEDYHKAREVKSVRGQTVPAGRELNRGEISALLGACENDPSPAGVRDAALVALLYGAGLRRAEVVALDLDDYDPQASQLLIKGKGRKERMAYLNDSLNRAMEDWLEVRGLKPGPFFLPIRKDGDLELRRMTTQAVYNLLRKRAAQAGVRNFSPHDLRRTFVSDLLEAGADIAIVAKMAGHANVQTTARYDRRPEEAKRRAASLLDVPYRGLRNTATDSHEK